jgi:hypothetical protein
VIRSIGLRTGGTTGTSLSIIFANPQQHRLEKKKPIIVKFRNAKLIYLSDPYTFDLTCIQ